jgi:all-trans-nonaprenyl-diphosphate synthase
MRAMCASARPDARALVRPGEGRARGGRRARRGGGGTTTVARAEGVESGRGAYTSVRGWLEARGAGAAVTRSEGRGRTTRRGAVTEADKSGRGMGRSARTSFDELDPEHNTSFGSSDESEGYDIAKITAPVAEDMEQMRMNLRDIIGRKNPLLLAAADQIFGAGGKRLRPVLVFLVARATKELMNMSDITDRQRRLAEITEMIHTASLVHDDVLDDCDTRRGKETIHTLYGTRVAILAGDFLFAQSSWFLANLDNLEVIKLISQVIADFADGEISQAGALFNCDLTLEEYLEKSHNKTASLIAASCKSAAVFSECTESVKVDMYEYGKHLGLAFQVVDDILDFTQSEEQLGKPQGQDLASGNLTAPTIFALKANPELRGLIENQFENEGDLQKAIDIVGEHGIEEARRLAKQEGDIALASLRQLPDSEAKRSLEAMVGYVLERIY